MSLQQQFYFLHSYVTKPSFETLKYVCNMSILVTTCLSQHQDLHFVVKPVDCFSLFYCKNHWHMLKVMCFFQCAGTTLVLRLSWSPDGQYLVSAHAMNGSGPTAQIIERDGWRHDIDFVGHRKAVTCVVSSLLLIFCNLFINLHYFCLQQKNV